VRLSYEGNGVRQGVMKTGDEQGDGRG